ncbi:hypothetical protein [Nannocystis radixulma]|uniref:Uncharacterized protein n=1 Tax=Nannocystis radixulma TaxID=2995305 RepID=A0ABT5B3E1_9BACT|nr:hypothetical protein [Nannocystis radixulma]MDC0668621.1 hypothetical protein [Nannocystis radixulma]
MSTLSAPIGTSSGAPPGTSTDDATTGAADDSTSSTSDDPTGSTGLPADRPVCNPVDDLEPNEIEDEAYVLNNITDDDSSGDFVESILAGDVDVDWFAYMGQDVAFAVVDPTSSLAADQEIRLCVFVECADGNTVPFTCVDSIYDESPDGRPGCCDTGVSALVSIDLYCGNDGGDESAYIFMRVDRGHPDECVPYDIDYHF